MASGFLRFRCYPPFPRKSPFDDNPDDNPRKNRSKVAFGGSPQALAEQSVHRFHRCLLHVWQDVGVAVEGHGDSRVAQQLGDDLGVHATSQQKRGARVAQVVNR